MEDYPPAPATPPLEVRVDLGDLAPKAEAPPKP
jgi:hypothetical protein